MIRSTLVTLDGLDPVRVTFSEGTPISSHESADKWAHTLYSAWVTYQGRTMRTTYRTGLAVKRPDARDLLSCLVADAAAGDQSFSNFCDDYGYSPDSLDARRAYNACDRTFNQLRRVFGKDVRAFWDAANSIDE